MIAAGCRFFAGYPMTPFTEVLEHMARAAPRGRRGVHERRERARGGGHGLGRGRHRDAGRHRLDRPGALAHAGIAVRDQPWPGCPWWCSTWPGPRATTTRPPGAAATATTATSCWRPPTWPRRWPWSDWPSSSPTRWRNPVLVLGDYYLAHTARSVAVPAVRTRPVPDWALDGSSGGSGHAKLISFLGTVKQRDDVGYDLADHYRRLRRPRGRDGRRGRADVRGSPY